MTRHKLFISYFHNDDQVYKNALERDFGHLAISKSVGPGEIKSDNSADYTKQLIQHGYLADTSVLAVLVGPNTLKRKHVDWEISAALMAKVGGHSGLIGVFLPEMRTSENGGWFYNEMPPRLADNIKSGYASYCSWDNFTNNFSSKVESAFNNRISLKNKIDNSRVQMTRNLKS